MFMTGDDHFWVSMGMSVSTADSKRADLGGVMSDKGSLKKNVDGHDGAH